MMQQIAVALMCSLLGACATPRGAPICKGPYTPINPPAAVSLDGTQPSG